MGVFSKLSCLQRSEKVQSTGAQMHTDNRDMSAPDEHQNSRQTDSNACSAPTLEKRRSSAKQIVEEICERQQSAAQPVTKPINDVCLGNNKDRRRSDFTIQQYRCERQAVTGKQAPCNVPEPVDLPRSGRTCSSGDL